MPYDIYKKYYTIAWANNLIYIGFLQMIYTFVFASITIRHSPHNAVIYITPLPLRHVRRLAVSGAHGESRRASRRYWTAVRDAPLGGDTERFEL